jgi:hypothetical protein
MMQTQKKGRPHCHAVKQIAKHYPTSCNRPFSSGQSCTAHTHTHTHNWTKPTVSIREVRHDSAVKFVFPQSVQMRAIFCGQARACLLGPAFVMSLQKPWHMYVHIVGCYACTRTFMRM